MFLEAASAVILEITLDIKLQQILCRKMSFYADDFSMPLPESKLNIVVDLLPNRKEVFFDKNNPEWTSVLEQVDELRFACVYRCYVVTVSDSHLLALEKTVVVRWSVLVFNSVELLLKTINLCFTVIHLLKRILLLSSNSRDRDYFPWDRSALSLSIFVFSFCCHRSLPCHRCCFAMHVSVPMMPFQHGFILGGKYKSIHESNQRNTICNTTLIVKQTTKKVLSGITGYTGPRNLCGPDERADSVNHEFYNQIRECSCFSSSFKPKMQHFPWQHIIRCDFPQFSHKKNLQTVLLLVLLSSSLFPNVAAASHTNNTTCASSSSSCPPIRLFCDTQLHKLLRVNQRSMCLDKNGNPLGDKPCCNELRKIQCNDSKAEHAYKAFLDTIMKYATSERYSGKGRIDCCKEAYKKWICSHYHPYYEEINGTKEPLHSESCFCKIAEKTCPFFRVHSNTKLYGGQPTYLCQGFQKDYDSNAGDCLAIEENLSCESSRGHEVDLYERDLNSSPASEISRWTMGFENYTSTNSPLPNAFTNIALIVKAGDPLSSTSVMAPSSCKSRYCRSVIWIMLMLILLTYLHCR